MGHVPVMLIAAACGRVDFDELHDAAPDGVDTSVLAVCEAHAGALLCEDFEGVADTGGTIELRVADEVVATGTGLDTRRGFHASRVGIPFSRAPQAGPATIYVDDIVVDVAPIGCTP